jgi:hypothetical protein
LYTHTHTCIIVVVVYVARYKCPYGMLLRVGDFGLCQKVPDVRHFQHTGDVRKAPYTPGGTEGYLPPEVSEGVSERVNA